MEDHPSRRYKYEGPMAGVRGAETEEVTLPLGLVHRRTRLGVQDGKIPH
jgi:hypothetical protein